MSTLLGTRFRNASHIRRRLITIRNIIIFTLQTLCFFFRFKARKINSYFRWAYISNIHFTLSICVLRTKKLIVEVMRVQQGETLTQILETPATKQQEMEHLRLQKNRVDVDKKKSSAVQRSSSAVGDSK